MYGECPYKFSSKSIKRHLSMRRVSILQWPEERFTQNTEIFFRNHLEDLGSAELDEYTTEIKVLVDEVMEALA